LKKSYFYLQSRGGSIRVGSRVGSRESTISVGSCGNHRGGSSNEGSGSSGSASLFTAGGFIESGLEFSLGSGNFGGVFNGSRANKVEDGCFKRSNFGGGGSDGEVGSLDTESQTIGDVVGGLDLTVGINVRVRSRDTSVGVSDFVLLGVDVGITVFEVAEFVLGLELGRGVSGGSYGNRGGGNNGGSVVDDGGGGHNGLGLDLDGFSGLKDRLSKDWGSISVRVSQTVRCGKDLGLGSSHQSGEKNLKIGKKKLKWALLLLTILFTKKSYKGVHD